MLDDQGLSCDQQALNIIGTCILGYGQDGSGRIGIALIGL
jgi:hypothetical protein